MEPSPCSAKPGAAADAAADCRTGGARMGPGSDRLQAGGGGPHGEGAGYHSDLPNSSHHRSQDPLCKGYLEKWLKIPYHPLFRGKRHGLRESEQVIVELFKEIDEPVQYVIVNEAGASVYSASKLATEEFPNFDVGQRSAASIARRIQDPPSGAGEDRSQIHRCGAVPARYEPKEAGRGPWWVWWRTVSIRWAWI